MLTLVFPIIIEKSICAQASYRVTSRHGHGGGQERSSRSSIQFQMPPQFVWHEYTYVYDVYCHQEDRMRMRSFQKPKRRRLWIWCAAITARSKHDMRGMTGILLGCSVVVCGDYFVMVVDWCYDTQLAKKGRNIVRKNIYNCVGIGGCICA